MRSSRARQTPPPPPPPPLIPGQACGGGPMEGFGLSSWGGPGCGEARGGDRAGGPRPRIIDTPSPPRPAGSAELAALFCRRVGCLDDAALLCRFVGFPGFCPTTDSPPAPGWAVQRCLLHPRQCNSLCIAQTASFFATSGCSCTAVNYVPMTILLPSAVHLEERLTVSQSVPEPASRQSVRYTQFGFFVSGRCGRKQQGGPALQPKPGRVVKQPTATRRSAVRTPVWPLATLAPPPTAALKFGRRGFDPMPASQESAVLPLDR